MMVMLSGTKYYIIALIRMVSPGALTFVGQVAAFPGYLSPFPSLIICVPSVYSWLTRQKSKI